MKKILLLFIGVVLILGIIGYNLKKESPIEDNTEELLQPTPDSLTEQIEVPEKMTIFKAETTNEEIDFEASFVKVYEAKSITVAYTTDTSIYWMNENWLDQIKEHIKQQTTAHVYLFDSKENIPKVEKLNWQNAASYEPFLVCQFTTSTTGDTKLCYGGKKEDGRWVVCMTRRN